MRNTRACVSDYALARVGLRKEEKTGDEEERLVAEKTIESSARVVGWGVGVLNISRMRMGDHKRCTGAYQQRAYPGEKDTSRIPGMFSFVR